MKVFSRTTLLAIAVVLILADHAWAWGPATHTKLAMDLLGNMGTLGSMLAALLTRHASSFVFGNIAADVVFAKRMSKVKQFCHHWSTGFRFLEKAEDDADKAFAYGYLSHLAADTIAHNKFVPRQLSITRSTLSFGHLYWEMRADALVDRPSWWTFEDVMAADHEHHHRVLEQELTATLLPYQFNRQFFDRMNRLMIRRYWVRCMSTWYRYSRWELPIDLVAEYHQESLERIISVLTEGDRSPVLRYDPNGRAALHQARLHRRAARRLNRRGLPTGKRASEAAAGLAPFVPYDHIEP